MAVDIAEFLNARLDEDEQMAREAADRAAEWFAEDEQATSWGVAPRDRAVVAGGKPIVTEDRDYSHGLVIDHIARHDPARVLADVAARREIVGAHSTRVLDLASHPGRTYWCSTCHVPGDYAGSRYCTTLRALASVYANHADFNPAWRLDGARVS